MSKYSGFGILVLSIIGIVFISGCVTNDPEENGAITPPLNSSNPNSQILTWYSGGPMGQFDFIRYAAEGTKAPYNCKVTKGMPPSGFTIANCIITGKVSDLSEGTTEILQPPFTIQINDSSEPPVSKLLDVIIRFVQNDMILNVKSLNACTANEPCSVELVDSIAGGSPPYNFQLDSMANGAPPMGMILNLRDGSLSGTPTKAGTYGFSLCAVDMAGVYRCKQATVTVGEEASKSETWSGTFITTGRNLCNDQGYLDGTGTITFTVPKSLVNALTGNTESEIKSWSKPAEPNSGTITWTETVAVQSARSDCEIRGGTATNAITITADNRGQIVIWLDDSDAYLMPGGWYTSSGGGPGGGSGGGIWIPTSTSDTRITGTINLDPGSGTFEITKTP